MRSIPGRPRGAARLARLLGLDGNPLRRASDRAEAWIRIGLLATFVIAAPVATVAAGHSAADSRSAAISAPATADHAVTAVLLQPSAAAGNLFAGDQGAWSWVKARWERPGAPARTLEVPVPAGLLAGSVVTVWLDASGHVTDPPGSGQFAGEIAFAMVMTPILVALTLLAALWFTRLFLNRKRLADWAADWSAVEPRWTGRR